VGRTLESKKEIREELEQLLDDAQVVMVIEYANMSVAEITKLRRTLRDSATVCKVTKNTLMKKAIAERPQWHSLESFLKGSSVFLMVKGDVSSALKAYQGYQKEAKKTALRGGVFDGRAFDAEQLKAVSELPPREVLLGQIAGLLNNVGGRLAGTINEVPSSLGRAINEVPVSVARAVKAMHEKQEQNG
jgi:large subunit ribosomal protein L10